MLRAAFILEVLSVVCLLLGLFWNPSKTSKNRKKRLKQTGRFRLWAVVMQFVGTILFAVYMSNTVQSQNLAEKMRSLLTEGYSVYVDGVQVDGEKLDWTQFDTGQVLVREYTQEILITIS